MRFRYPIPPASEITPEPIYRQRREFMKHAASALAVAAMPALFASPLSASQGALDNTRWLSSDETLTDPQAATTYNNFFEFGSGKDDPAAHAHQLQTDSWTVTVDGEVETPGTFALEDLLRPHVLEERIYRLRCVEGWSMVIPWLGFELGELLKRFRPTSRAKFVQFETLYDPEQMPGQRRDILDWPYREALRIDEAMHPLTLLAVGMYGEPLPNQNGAPLRLVVPWKYGFKSIKSVVRIHLQEAQPTTSWNERQPREYGFYANVNPTVRHPRWHQATERRLGETRRRRTEMFNGYEELVAHLYRGMDLEKHY